VIPGFDGAAEVDSYTFLDWFGAVLVDHETESFREVEVTEILWCHVTQDISGCDGWLKGNDARRLHKVSQLSNAHGGSRYSWDSTRYL
jgi:hypothetical protein